MSRISGDLDVSIAYRVKVWQPVIGKPRACCEARENTKCRDNGKLGMAFVRPMQLLLCGTNSKVVQNNVPFGVVKVQWFRNILFLGIFNKLRIFWIGEWVFVVRTLISEVIDQLNIVSSTCLSTKTKESTNHLQSFLCGRGIGNMTIVLVQ